MPLTRAHCLLILLLATILAYGVTFRNRWSYDDLPVVVQNPDAHSLSGFLADTRPGRPLRELSYILDYQLFAERPAGYRVQQLAWHAANGMLLCLLLGELGVAWPWALAGALLFLLHPLQVESVASIANRKEALALFFSLLALRQYRRLLAAAGWQRWVRVLGVLVCIGLALAGNERAVALPLVLLAYEWLLVPPGERWLLKHWRLTAGLTAIVALFAFRRYGIFFTQQDLLKVYSKQSFATTREWYPLYLGVMAAFTRYLGSIFLPWRLAPEYHVALSTSLWQPLAWTGGVLLAGLAGLVVYLRRRLPLVAFGVAWALLMYLPASNLMPVGYMQADRYLYLVLPGVGMAAAGLLASLDRPRLWVWLTPLFLLLAALTIRQSTYWYDEHSLWRHAARVNGDSTWVRESAALSYLLTGELDEAERQAREALRLDRFNTRAYFTLAKILEAQGRFAEAIGQYQLFMAFGNWEFPDDVKQSRWRVHLLRQRLGLPPQEEEKHDGP